MWLVQSKESQDFKNYDTNETFKKSCLSQGKPGSSKLSVKFINFDFPESGQATLFKINYNFKKVTPYKKIKSLCRPRKVFFYFHNSKGKKFKTF